MTMTFKLPLVAAVVAMTLSACSSSPIEKTSLPPQGDASVVVAKRKAHVQPEFQMAVTSLSVDRPVVQPLEHHSTANLPAVLVGPFAASNMSIIDLMDAISFESGVAFSLNDQSDSSVEGVKISLIDPAKLPFSVAIKKIAQSANVFYSYNDAMLTFDTHRSYQISVPQVAGASASLAEALASVGATDIADNSSTGGLIFKADPRTLRKVESLASTWGNNRTMIVYDSYLYEVALNHEDASGLSIESLQANLGNGTAELKMGSQPVSGSGGLALTLAGVSGDVAVQAIAKSIQSAGDYKVLSQPTISVVSGGSSSLDVGEKQQYVSGMTANVTEGVTSSDVQVDVIETGLKLEVTGQYTGGMIVTELDLRIASLLGFEEFETSTNTLKLPNTAERQVKQTLYARPGDTLVVAGVMTSQIDNNKNNNKVLPMFGSKSKKSGKTELIIVMRPRIVNFGS